MLSLFLLFLHLVFDVEKCASQFSGDYVLESRFGCVLVKMKAVETLRGSCFSSWVLNSYLGFGGSAHRKLR